MAFVQKRKKPNDFLFGSVSAYTGTDPRRHALGKHSGVLVPTFDGKGNYHGDVSRTGDKFIYVYHAEKRRRRYKQVERVFNKVDGKTQQVTVSTKMTDKHWIVRLFRFPYDQVKSVKQHQHHFDIELI